MVPAVVTVLYRRPFGLFFGNHEKANRLRLLVEALLAQKRDQKY